MPNPTTLADLEARWRPLSEAEAGNAQALLDDTWALLSARRQALDANLIAGAVSEANVVRIVCAMVLRVLRNPDGKLEESLDDYRYKRHELLASGELHVTAAELADLTPTTGRRNSVRLVVYGDD